MNKPDQKADFLYNDGVKIAAAINCSLLKNYLFDAEISATDNSGSVPALYAPFLDSAGCIAFSAQAITALVNMSLGQPDFDSEPLTATPAAIAIISNLAATISEAVGLHPAHHVSSECPPDFDLDSAFAFKIYNQYDFWVYVSTANHSQISPDTPVELTAVIKRTSLPLDLLSEWKVGSFLPLGIEKNAEISILHNSKTMFKGVMGQKSRHIAVKITKRVP